MIRQKKFARRDAYDFYSLTWKELGTDTMHTSQEFLVHESRLPLRSLNSQHVLLFSGFLNCSWFGLHPSDAWFEVVTDLLVPLGPFAQ